jgi:hypothetical protein
MRLTILGDTAPVFELRMSGSALRNGTTPCRTVMPRGKLAANVMSPRVGFHADQAARNVGQPALKLSARALQLQNDRPALIEADKMEAILAEIDADRADGGG